MGCEALGAEEKEGEVDIALSLPFNVLLSSEAQLHWGVADRVWLKLARWRPV